MEQKTYQGKHYETVAEFCRRWNMSRRKFDYLKQAGIVPVIQTGPRFIRIDPEQADAALARFTTGGDK